MEEMTHDELKRSSFVSKSLADLLIIICKNHIVQNSKTEKINDQAVREAITAMTALVVEIMHSLYTDEYLNKATDLFCKTLKYSMYILDQNQGETDDRIR